MTKTTKTSLGKYLADQGLVPSGKAGKEIVDAVFDKITADVTAGTVVSIDKIGAFSRMEVAEKTGKIPGTDRTYTKAAHAKAHFKMAKALKDI